MLENEIYDRTDGGGERITPQSFNLLIGLVLLWGFFVNFLLVKYVATERLLEMNFYVLIGGYIAMCLIGSLMYSKSSNPLVSFIGYNFVVVPFGLMLNVIISAYNPDVVLNAIIVTGGVTVLMVVLGTLFPSFFEKIGGALFIALLSVVVVQMIQIFVFKANLAIMDWLVALIFCGYIGFDWARANRMPKTVDNAIDGAAAIYMDIINLFIRVLRILGRAND